MLYQLPPQPAHNYDFSSTVSEGKMNIWQRNDHDNAQHSTKHYAHIYILYMYMIINIHILKHWPMERYRVDALHAYQSLTYSDNLPTLTHMLAHMHVHVYVSLSHATYMH